MSGSLVDLFLIVLIIVFAINGYRQGFFVGLLSFVGFFGGAALGLQLGPWLAGFTTSNLGRVFIALGTVFSLAILGQALAGWLGSRIRSAIQSRTGRRIDDAGGALISVVALLAVAWLVAAPLGSSALPGLARSVRNSAILHGVNAVMPGQIRALSDGLRRSVDTNGFPDVFGSLDPTRVRNVPPPDPALVGSRMVQASEPAVVKVHGDAPSCDRHIEGSGFIYAPEHVMTNAHVVAGTRGGVSVLQDGHRRSGQVVVYDPERDLAVLYVPGLVGPVLRFDTRTAASGTDAVVLGYPLDGPFNAQSARIRDAGPIRGPDIYASATVTRQVYTIRGLVRSGNSGGPLMSTDGAVLGVIFAAVADDPQTGFALTAGEASSVARLGSGATQATGTGSCAEG